MRSPNKAVLGLSPTKSTSQEGNLPVERLEDRLFKRGKKESRNHAD